MRYARSVGMTAVLLAALGGMAAHANPPGFNPAARLSAAAGGSLDSELGEAGGLAHAVDYSSVRLFPGRSVEYRRRVALDLQLAARSRIPTDLAVAANGRTAD
jgi:hypothetical protein